MDRRHSTRLRLGLALVMLMLAVPSVAWAALPPGGSFIDDDGSVHEANIEAIASDGITKGCGNPSERTFCPDRTITRGQMAAFLVRALGLGPANGDYFSDDDGTTFEDDINRLFESGITKGCGKAEDNTFCPDRAVTRGQMAAFLVRAFGYGDPGSIDFSDDDGSIFETDIEKLYTAGVTKGCGQQADNTYCPDKNVTRAQMASFLARALGLAPIVPPPAWVLTAQGFGPVALGDHASVSLSTLVDVLGRSPEVSSFYGCSQGGPLGQTLRWRGLNVYLSSQGDVIGYMATGALNMATEAGVRPGDPWPSVISAYPDATQRYDAEFGYWVWIPKEPGDGLHGFLSQTRLDNPYPGEFLRTYLSNPPDIDSAWVAGIVGGWAYEDELNAC